MMEEPLGLGAALWWVPALYGQDPSSIPKTGRKKKKAFYILTIGLQVNINCVQEGQGLWLLKFCININLAQINMSWFGISVVVRKCEATDCLTTPNQDSSWVFCFFLLGSLFCLFHFNVTHCLQSAQLGSHRNGGFSHCFGSHYVQCKLVQV